MRGKKIAFTITVPKQVTKSRVEHRPTKADRPKKGKGAYNRHREKRDWRNHE